MHEQKMLLMHIPGLKSTDPTGQEHDHWNQADLPLHICERNVTFVNFNHVLKKVSSSLSILELVMQLKMALISYDHTF